jgi:uncharacterized protein (DUF2235 family)
MPKNIVVFADGTGQEGGKKNNTNVYKLFNMVLDRSVEQVAFYDRGLGTGWRKLTGNVGGGGISKNIMECYEFIFDNFQAGDQIYLFGFSRGAATVRSLSGFIHMFGILPKSRRELIKQAHKIYRIKGREKREAKAKDFIFRHHTIWTKIKFLGVWDTVAALGLPFKSIDVVVDKIPFWKHSFHDFTLSESVANAYHALAIDDERRTFHPVLWDPHVREGQMMKQVWFCGMHTDVGGGYAEPQLSDIALEWMVQKAVENGLRIYPGQKLRCNPDPNGMMHDSRGGTFKSLYRKLVRKWDPERREKPTIHASVLLRKVNRRNAAEPEYSPWILSSGMEYDVEPWAHPGQWAACPEGLEQWCKPVDPRASSAADSQAGSSGG